MPALQNFQSQKPPAVSAVWLNQVDVLLTTVFGQAATNPAARSALCSDLPLEIDNGGTASRTAAGALASLGGINAAALAAAIAAANVPFETNAIETIVLETLGFSVVNSNYPIGWVDRYKTNSSPGTTDMTEPCIIAAAVATAGGGDMVFGPTYLYLVTAAINCTFGGSANQFGYCIRFIGPNGLDGAATTPHPLSPFGVFARHSQVAVFDMTGADSIHLIGVPIRTDITTFPKTAVLWARNNVDSGANMKMLRCTIAGMFSDSLLYNYGIETNEVWGNKLYNLATSANTAIVRLTANNISGLTSAFATGANGVANSIATGSQSTTCHSHKSNTYVNQAGASTSDCIVLEGAGRASFDDCFGLSASSAAAGRSLFYVNQSVAPSDNISIIRFQGETASFIQQYGVCFDNSAPVSGSNEPLFWSIEDSRLSFSGAFSVGALGTNCQPINMNVRNISAQGSTAAIITFPGTLLTSTIEDPSVILNIGVSQNNNLTGDTNRWGIGAGAVGGITTRTNDSWRDTGTANKSFAPGIATTVNGWTIVGALTQRARYLLEGNTARFQIVLQAATTLACTSSATIPTLPAAAVDVAVVSVTDYTTGASLGTATVSGNTITFHTAIAATGDEIVISGTYFVA
jgi:hypothetical protein